MDVVRGHEIDPGAGREAGEAVVAGRVERVAVVPQLDDDVLTTEHVDQPVEGADRGPRAVLDEGSRHGALAAAGEDLPVVTGRGRRDRGRLGLLLPRPHGWMTGHCGIERGRVGHRLVERGDL